MGVVVTNESNMASYFSEAGNLNSSNVDVCFYVAGPSNSGLVDLFDFVFSSRSCTFTIAPLLALLAAIMDLSVITTPILPFGALRYYA